MCYYNGQKVTREEFIRLKMLEKAVKDYGYLDEALIDGFSDKPVAVLKPNADKTNFDIVQMEWGMIAPFVPNREEANIFKRKFTTLNAKAENLFTNEQGKRSMWASAIKKGRCLILSTGFFEWRHIHRTHAKTGLPLKSADKYPYHINVINAPYFFMAGIYQDWTDRETGEVIETVALITTKANSVMAQVHNSKMRMPTILNDDLAYEWIMSDLSDERIMQIASTQLPSEEMVVHTISPQFKALVEPCEPFEYADLPPLEVSL